MAQEKKKGKRKVLSKKLRFEVFKRDSFTCQYCGRKAPDVILQVDHIKPVSKGGNNDIMNLVTSCVDCNLGKHDKELDDNSVIALRQKQAEELQARREQIEMLRDWHIELANQHNLQLQSINEFYKKLTNDEFVISEQYLTGEISKFIVKYGVGEVLDALLAGYQTYGDPRKALDKLDGILVCRNDPEVNERVKLLNYMKYRLRYFDKKEASILLRKGYAKNGEQFYSLLKTAIDKVSPCDWDSIRMAIEEWLKK